MIIRFLAKNIYSFKEQIEFNLLPSSTITKLSHHKIRGDIGVLRYSAIYGGNGVGKSNLIKAISLLEDMVVEGRNPKAENIKFKIGDENKTQPISLGIEFATQEKVFFYTVTFDKDQIIYEYLAKILKDNSEISIDYKLKEIIEEELSESLEKEKAIQNELNNINIQITRYASLFEETLNYDEIKAAYDEITDNYNDLMNKKSVLDEALMGLKVKVKSVKQHLELLKSGAAECPVCGHPILNPEEEFKKHTEEQNENKKEFKQIKEELTELEEAISKIGNDKTQYEALLEKATEQVNSVDDFKKAKENKQTKEAELNSIQLVINKNREQLADINANEKHRDLINTAKEQVTISEQRLKDNKKERARLEKEISTLNVLPKSTYKVLLNNLKEKEDLLVITNIQKASLDGELKLIVEQAKQAVQDYKRCKEASENYERLHNQITIMNLTNQSLIKFKEQRIKNSIPELTDIASEILARFTDNKFTQLILTDKFETFVVTENNVKRPVSQLSGGELSAAAIALRLAIALFLNNGQQHLLILDEVLTAMSSDRSQLILETITSLTNAQIILIAHNDGINSFADKVVHL